MIRIRALPLNNTPEAMGTVRQNGYMCSNGYGAVRHGEARGSWRLNKGAACQTCTQRGDLNPPGVGRAPVPELQRWLPGELLAGRQHDPEGVTLKEGISRCSLRQALTYIGILLKV